MDAGKSRFSVIAASVPNCWAPTSRLMTDDVDLAVSIYQERQPRDVKAASCSFLVTQGASKKGPWAMITLQLPCPWEDQ